jgi:hypothetical protein
MDKNLRRILTECIRDIETGEGDVEARLERYPNLVAEMRSNLDLWQDLESACLTEPGFAGQQRGQQKVLAALTDLERRDRRMTPTLLAPAAAKAAAVIAGIALLVGGTAGASAALGGPDVGGEALSAVGINNAPDAAQNGKDHANPNAFEGSDNAGQGIDNASDTGKEHANPNAFGPHGNADEEDADADDAADDGLNTAGEHAADQADRGLDTAADAGAPDDVPPTSPPASDSVPEDAPVPDSLPVGH